jgi:hypothetical protein
LSLFSSSPAILALPVLLERR